jgi:CubicO group peptidase (beta-lactamase class C family)
MSGRPERTHAELIAEALRRGISAPPGAKFAYSNFGFCLLGRIIEKATGRPYEDYVREAVLAPAGAAGMTIAGNGIAGRKPDEVRYHGQGNDNPYSFNVARMDSHGGWIATAAQIARFADAADVPLLSPASATEMVRPSAADPAYACGWRISKSGNRWHAGSLPGTTTLLVRTRRGLCWAGLVNTRNRNDGLARALDRLMWAMARAVPEWRA